VFAFIGAKHGTLTGEAGGLGAGFWQEGQSSTSEMLIFGGMWVELRQYMWRSFVRATSERI